MRLSKDDVEKIQKWMQSNNYDYCEFKKDDPSKVLGYKVDTLSLRERTKQAE